MQNRYIQSPANYQMVLTISATKELLKVSLFGEVVATVPSAASLAPIHSSTLSEKQYIYKHKHAKQSYYMKLSTFFVQLESQCRSHSLHFGRFPLPCIFTPCPSLW